MTRHRILTYFVLGIVALAAAAFLVSRSFSGDESTVAALAEDTHFHGIAVDPHDANRLYLATHHGVFGDLQKSTDGGRSWSRVGHAPEGIIGLAASSKEADRVYAATQRGLMVSSDGGRRWRPAHEARQPATMVQVTPGGTTYAFIAGTGLVRTEEPELDWTTLGDGFGGEYVLHLAAGRNREQPILYAITVNPETRAQALHVSRDGGRSWNPLTTAPTVGRWRR